LKTEKKRREKVINKVLIKTALENNKKLIGQVVEVLVDGTAVPAQATQVPLSSSCCAFATVNKMKIPAIHFFNTVIRIFLIKQNFY